MDTYTINPCGCGGLSLPEWIKIGNDGRGYLSCPKCRIETPIKHTMAEAVTIWNNAFKPPHGSGKGEV